MTDPAIETKIENPIQTPTETVTETPNENAREERYDFRAIEQKWQARWHDADLYKVETDPAKPKFYGLEMFPYPSGAGISVGHCRNYVPMDVACRLKTMQGFRVLHPMGWDSFGQPAENEAIKQERNPAEMVPEYAANYKRQLNLVGMAYDWSREINTSLPDYYRWTQWIFLKLYERNLATRSFSTVNWDPVDKTVLSNDEVVNGRGWRSNALIEKKLMPQWYLKITSYAQRLLDDLETIQWPDYVKALQANWIGRSEGAEVHFAVPGTNEKITVFTTRPDTLWGATFMVLAPEHPLVAELTPPEQSVAVREYVERAQRMTEIDRQSTERTKTGVFIGAYADNPVNGKPIPIWIADYVLMGYGTGAIMAVPAHDQRDFEFARKYDIPVVLVYKTSPEQTEAEMTEALPSGGTLADFPPEPGQTVSACPFVGEPNNKETVAKVIRWIEENGIGRGVVNYRLRDWLISRQRYWGCPIPIIHCETCGIVPVPESNLPVLLPAVASYAPTGTGESPLAGIPEFVNCTCPTCGKPARRETDTMAGSACSSWYFLRFTDPQNSAVAFDPEIAASWMPVDLYVGGTEHAVGHLLYARFWTKVLHDAGYIPFDEPFMHYRNQGMVLANTPGIEIKKDESVQGSEEGDGDSDEPIEDWKALKPEERGNVPESEWVWRWVKMSKSKGNVVTPDEMAEQFGTDSLRLFCLFVAPFDEVVQWSNDGIENANRFLRNRVWRQWVEARPLFIENWRDRIGEIAVESLNDGERKLRRKLHQTVQKVGGDIENFRFNTAISALMEFTNELSAFRNALPADHTETQKLLLSEVLETLPLLIAPITPHLADELWERLGKSGFTYKLAFPVADEGIATEDTVEIVVQINGKVRARLTVAVGLDAKATEDLALAHASVQSELAGKTVRKVIAVPGKLVNIVAG